jgi:beta-galactosidase/beta-glucuronidase
VTLDPPPAVPRVTLADGVGRVELDGEVVLEVEEPELWWPNGLGEQRLYRAGDFAVGFRTVELVPNEGAPADALPYRQEFSQSSSGLESTPSDDPDFVATLAHDAREIVPWLAHHPSLFAWCGGNELACPDGEPIDERSPAIRALADIVRTLDPERAWLPSSPTGPQGRYDMHCPWELRVCVLTTRTTTRWKISSTASSASKG